MSHTDPIADMLTRIRNAILTDKKTVAIPFSKLKLDILKIIKSEGYIAGFKTEGQGPRAQIVLELKYLAGRKNVIEGLKRISRPGRRVYGRVEKLPKVLDGLGVAVVSTSQGILSGKECKKRNISGEVLLHIW